MKRRGFGLEIGARTLALVGVQMDGTRARLLGVERAGPFAAGRRAGDGRSRAAFRAAAVPVLRAWRRRHALGRDPLVIAAPSVRGLVFPLTVAAVEPRAVANLLNVEIGAREAGIPGAAWRRAIATRALAAHSTFAQVGLQRDAVVAGVLELLAEAGLHPTRVVPAPCALWQALLSDHRITRPARALHVGRDALDRLLVDPEGVQAASSSFGLHRLGHLLELEGLSAERAEERLGALAGGAEPSGPTESRALATYLDEIAAIEAALARDGSGPPAAPAGRVLLTGVGSRLRGLAGRFETDGSPVETSTAARLLDGEPSGVSTAGLEPVALGAALAAASGTDLPSFVEPRRPRGIGAWVRLASAAALLAACALWHARQVADARDEEARHERGTALVEREERRAEDVQRAQFWSERVVRATERLAAEREHLLATYGGFALWSRLPLAAPAMRTSWERDADGAALAAVVPFPWSRRWIDPAFGMADRLARAAAGGLPADPWRRALVAALDDALRAALSAGFGDALASFRPPRVERAGPARLVRDPLGGDRLALAVRWHLASATEAAPAEDAR